jgi:hypothetical protein
MNRNGADRMREAIARAFKSPQMSSNNRGKQAGARIERTEANQRERSHKNGGLEGARMGIQIRPR